MTDPNLLKKNLTQSLWFFLCGLFMVGTLLLLILFFMYLLKNGFQVLSWEFLTKSPRRNMTEGGIMPAIIGTFYVASLTVLISVPLGIGSAIYLNEYARQGIIVKIIRLCIRNLSGVPSIVYGLFGLGVFAATLKLGTSILSSALTLAIMSLPWVITSSEEALKSVPNSFREAGLALGTTKWQTIRYLVLPVAIPGMATGSILSLARSAGETAPIILTGAAFFLPVLPSSVRDRFMALPYHLFILATQHTKISEVRPLAYGTALVLILMVLGLNMGAVIWRMKIRKNQNW
jgi:phosphate transport system permease protein